MNYRDRSLWGNRDRLAGPSFGAMPREMTRWVEDFLRTLPSLSPVPVSRPSLDIRESEAELCVIADLPGVNPADLDVRVDGSTLFISAERRSEHAEQQPNYHMAERRQGFMQRSVRLPFTPDPEQVRAEYTSGVLTVHMPKHGQRLTGQRIPVECRDAPAGGVRGTGASGELGGASGSTASTGMRRESSATTSASGTAASSL